jgi:hypothetical protein
MTHQCRRKKRGIKARLLLKGTTRLRNEILSAVPVVFVSRESILQLQRVMRVKEGAKAVIERNDDDRDVSAPCSFV